MKGLLALIRRKPSDSKFRDRHLEVNYYAANTSRYYVEKVAKTDAFKSEFQKEEKADNALLKVNPKQILCKTIEKGIFHTVNKKNT